MNATTYRHTFVSNADDDPSGDKLVAMMSDPRGRYEAWVAKRAAEKTPGEWVVRTMPDGTPFRVRATPTHRQRHAPGGIR